MTRRMMYSLLATMLLTAVPALAGDSDSDSDRNARAIAVRLAALELERGRLRIAEDLYELAKEIELEVLALVETRERFGKEADIDLEAWKIGAGRWEIRTLSFNRSLLDDWRLEVTADKLKEATKAQVMIDGKLYLWEEEIYQKVLLYLLDRECTIAMFGITHLNLPVQYQIDRADFGAGCRQREPMD